MFPTAITLIWLIFNRRCFELIGLHSQVNEWNERADSVDPQNTWTVSQKNRINQCERNCFSWLTSLLKTLILISLILIVSEEEYLSVVQKNVFCKRNLIYQAEEAFLWGGKKNIINIRVKRMTLCPVMLSTVAGEAHRLRHIAMAIMSCHCIIIYDRVLQAGINPD